MNGRPANRLLVVAALALVACAAEQPEVNRVQTNLVDKGIFEGEWWYSSTAIDVDFDEAELFGAANAFGPFEGSMSTDYAIDFNRAGPYVLSPYHSFPIARIRWVIDEDYLFAYRSFELTEGGNRDGDAPDFRGQPLAVFAIEDHVDVRREYDSVTGEETNVVVENTSDRDWFDRQYMRVDWSENLLTDFAGNSFQAESELFDSFSRESVSLQIQEGQPGYPDSYRPQFIRVEDDPDYRYADEWPEDERDRVHAMSFVTQEVWSPGERCLNGPGTCAAAQVTLRQSFLRVPPEHEYVAKTMTHREFDRFGYFRSAKPTYARGGEDKEDLRIYCYDGKDCGPGGVCDTARNICVGGLSDDRGETDFLSFVMSRQNFHAHALTDTECAADWECNGRYLGCDDGDDECEDELRAMQGSVCDPAAGRCTVPLRDREPRKVVYHLSKDFPPHLVRVAFDALAQWNEGLMRGQRAAKGEPAIDDERDCTDDERKERDLGEDDECVIDAVDLATQALIDCQEDDPAAYCWCGSPEAERGQCARRYDPFESPERAAARGIPTPYDCYVEGPKDVKHPERYEDYDPEKFYDYHFVGDECLLVLEANACDVDPEASCQELGDLRYQFLTYVAHGSVPFGGVAQPLSDPISGELVVSLASIAGESVETHATVATQLFPVLRGETPEDEYFSGENVRGYFARAGRVEHPVGLAPSGGDGYTVNDPSRPADSNADAFQDLVDRFEQRTASVQQLRGQEGRAAIYSDRLVNLRGTPTEARLSESVGAELSSVAADDATQREPETSSVLESGPLDVALREREQRRIMSARNLDDFAPQLYNAQYWRYWADAFAGRPLGEASIRMQQAYFRAVAGHEMGHALGLRHNFAGSLDRDNFHDGYLKIARDEPLPSYAEYDDPALGGNDDGDVTRDEAERWAADLREVREERLRRGAGNVMSSSIMDYDGDLSGWGGVGRYDVAAVLFGYFDRAEMFATATPTQPPGGASEPVAASIATLAQSDLYRRDLWTYYRGGEDCYVDSECPYSAGRADVVGQDVTQRCMTSPSYGQVEPCEGRTGCLCSDFFDDVQAYGQTPASRRSHAPVEYMFCHDGRTNDVSWCTQFDAGESFQEVVEHYRRAWTERYPQVYFRNFRRTLPRRGYSQSTVIEAVKIYQHLFFRDRAEPDFRTNQGPLGRNDQLFASADVLNWLGEIISAPDVGSYAYDEDANVYRHIDEKPGAPGSDLDLQPGQGFYLWSAYQDGLNGFSRLERAGTFLDKFLAIEALTRRDWGVQYTPDERYYVNFYNVFDREVIDLFGGLILRNPAAYAPRLAQNETSDPVVRYLNLARGLFAAPGANSEAVYTEPAIDGIDTEVLRDAATIYALAEFPVYYDTSFEQRMLVFKTGSGDGYEIPTTRSDGTPTCAFGDDGCDEPDYIRYDSDRLHTTYVAVVIRPGGESEIDERQIGFQLLRRLNERQARVRELEALDDPSDDELAEADRLRLDLERDESFVEYLIETARGLGISSWIL